MCVAKSFFKNTFLKLCLLGSLWGCTKQPPTLFSILKAEQTGLDFSNTITENDSFNILRFEYLYNGGGLGVADFNLDGLSDVFFAGNQASSRLYLNQGDLKFKDVSVAAQINTQHWCTGVAIVDINADGLPDIHLSTIHPKRGHTAPNQFFIHQGVQNGIPVFKELAQTLGLADTAYCTQAAFLDYDRDGDLDVYLLNNALEDFNRNAIRQIALDGSGKSTDRLYRNEGIQANGLPRFTDVSRAAGITQEGWGLGIAVDDFNQDGYPDIYCANDFLSSDILWINNQDGSFSNQTERYLRHSSHNSMGCDIADINNDGYPEIMTLDMMPFTNPRIKSMFGVPSYDRFALNLKIGYHPQYVRNMLQLNNGPNPQGQITFSEIGQMAGVFATDWSWSCLFADFDNDGWRDLFISNGYDRDVTDLDFTAFNAESAMFGDPAMRRKNIEKAVSALPGVKISNFIFSNNRDLSFSDQSKAWGIQSPSYSNGAAYADFDNDGDLDLVVNNLNDPAVLYRNNLEKIQPKPHFLRVKLADTQGIQGTVVQIHYRDTLQRLYFNPVRGYKSSIEPVLHFGLGKITQVDSLVLLWPNGKRSRILQPALDTTLSIQQKSAEIFVQKKTSLPSLFNRIAAPNWQHQENEYVDFNHHFLWRRMYSRSGPILAKGDVDNNGYEDVLVGGAAGQGMQLFLQNAAGQFTQQTLFAGKPEEDTGLSLFDADQDGDLDLYAVSGGSEFLTPIRGRQDRFYENQGKGEFMLRPVAIPQESSAGSCVYPADYDHDGDLDLFVGGRIEPQNYPLAPRSYLWQNQWQESKQLRFVDRTPPYLQTPGMVTDAVWVNLDDNSYPSLVLVGEFMPITIFKNAGGKLHKEARPELVQTSGWWNTIRAADLDQDGDPDFVLGNFGLNTRYRASAQEPLCIYAKDYDNNGQLDPIFTYAVQGQEVPVHPRDALLQQIPALKKRMLDYATYGKMGFKDLIQPSELRGVYRAEAQVLASVYLENRGEVGFVLHPLPRLAQLAPIQAILLEDYDGDGHLDVLLAGNDYGEDVQIGRQDAGNGLLLRGNGNGNFQPLSADKSGFWVPQDARSILELKTAKKTRQIWVGVNQQRLQIFEQIQPPSSAPMKPTIFR
jgi:hypothetical protein